MKSRHFARRSKELGEATRRIREEHETQEALIERIREGTKAQKEIRQRPKKKVSA
jgi:cellobiose-specific phosphotransferase system component IIA